MSSNNIYIVDWKKLGKWILPIPLRQSKIIALCSSVLGSISYIDTLFGYFRSNTIYRLSITPQVALLEKALNDRFDIITRGIYITDGVDYNPIPLFLKSESKPVILSKKSEATPIVLYTKSETSLFSSDFVVNVPSAVSFDLSEMSAFVNSYKLASKTFKITIV